eukprot:14659.XXX_156606_156815_1 [CDS] Oithona nana genome sequencing.
MIFGTKITLVTIEQTVVFLQFLQLLVTFTEFLVTTFPMSVVKAIMSQKSMISTSSFRAFFTIPWSFNIG